VNRRLEANKELRKYVPAMSDSESSAGATSPRHQAEGRSLFRFTKSFLLPAFLLLLWGFFSTEQFRELPLLKGTVIAEKLSNPQILPPPWIVLKRWLAYASPLQRYDKTQGSYVQWLFSGELPIDLWSSLQRVLTGFAIAIALAVPLGILMGANRLIYDFVNPSIQVLRPIPPIAWIPLAMLWFGLGDPPAYFLIFLGAFFPILINTIGGVRNVDGIYIRAATNLGAKRFALFWRIILPAATPQILTGIRVGLGVAFICVIIAEMIAVQSGLGFRILEAREYSYTDKVIAGMFTIGLLGLTLDYIITRINSYLLRWHRSLDQAKN
jgi:NitT/TauT family transport system permease protein